MVVLVATAVIAEGVPLLFHPVGSGVIECAEAEVIEHGLHPQGVLHVDIFLHNGCVDVAVGNIFIDL